MKYNTMQKVLPGNINFFVSLISIFAVSISMIVSVVFWSTLANTLYAMLLMGSIGLILDATKLCSLYYLAKSTANSKAVIFVASLLIYMLLGFVSIVASTEVMKTEISKTSELNLKQQTSYNILVNQLESKQHELKNLIVIQTRDLEFGYRKRAVELSSRIKQTELELNNLKSKLALLNNSSPNSINNFAISLAGVLQIAPDSLNNLLTLIFGCLLELSSGFLIFIKANSSCYQKTSVRTTITNTKSSVKKNLVSPKPVTGDKYQAVKTAIINQSYPPKLRQIREQFNLGTTAASNYFKQLTALLHKEDKVVNV